MSLDNVREQCERAVARLPLRSPFDVGSLIDQLAADRGRPIELHRWPEGINAPCGVWVATASTDHIFYDGLTTPIHQRHIILHELGHLLLEHELPPPQDAWARRLLPSLDPAMVSTALGRSSYADDDEIAAELFASMVIERVNRLGRASPTSLDPQRDGVVERLTAALAASPTRG